MVKFKDLKLGDEFQMVSCGDIYVKTSEGEYQQKVKTYFLNEYQALIEVKTAEVEYKFNNLWWIDPDFHQKFGTISLRSNQYDWYFSFITLSEEVFENLEQRTVFK